MTRGEAIAIFRGFKFLPREMEAVDMAIKALEQEPCEDAISRQDLDKAIYERFHEEDSPNNITDVCLGAVRNFIKNFPSVTPQPQWIPVSERLPEDKTYVLTTIKVPNRIAHARTGWYEGGFFHNDNGDTWKATDREVIAWMLSPESYKEESEE